MKALVWTGPREMEMQELAAPVAAPEEVLLRVTAAGICGSELSGYLGKNTLRRPPLVMGHEFTGVVEVGTGGLLPGTPVVVNPLLSCGGCDRCEAEQPHLCRKRVLMGAGRPGAFAELVTVPASACHPLPAEMSAETAALAEPLACAVRAVHLAQTQPGEQLLIYGAGPIGLLCLAVARRQGGTRVIVADTNSGRLRVAERWGANETVNPAEHDVLETVGRLTGGRGMGAVIDAVGHGSTRNGALRALKPGGLVVFIGLHDEESSIPANLLVRQELRITGSFAYTPADFTEALNLLASGAIPPIAEWVEIRPLAAGPESFAELVAPGSEPTKILLRP